MIVRCPQSCRHILWVRERSRWGCSGNNLRDLDRERMLISERDRSSHGVGGNTEDGQADGIVILRHYFRWSGSLSAFSKLIAKKPTRTDTTLIIRRYDQFATHLPWLCCPPPADHTPPLPCGTIRVRCIWCSTCTEQIFSKLEMRKETTN